MTEQLSDMFSYEEVAGLITQGSEIIFREVVLLKDIVHPKFGAFPAGTYFHEVWFEFPSLRMTFMSDHPHTGYTTDLEIDVRVEQDI